MANTQRTTLAPNQLALLDRAREAADSLETTNPEMAGLLRELAALVYLKAS